MEKTSSGRRQAKESGNSSAWLERTVRDGEVAGSNPVSPTTTLGGVMILEIRAAEGGDDAKMLVEDQVTIYARVATKRGL